MCPSLKNVWHSLLPSANWKRSKLYKFLLNIFSFVDYEYIFFLFFPILNYVIIVYNLYFNIQYLPLFSDYLFKFIFLSLIIYYYDISCFRVKITYTFTFVDYFLVVILILNWVILYFHILIISMFKIYIYFMMFYKIFKPLFWILYIIEYYWHFFFNM